MYDKIQIVFDADDPEKLGRFWALALGYIPQPPPEGFASAEDFLRSIGIKEAELGDQYAIVDPDDAGPRIYFQKVRDGKTGKNRVHLDVRVAGRHVRGEHRKRLVSEHVERLVRAGATVAWETDDVRGSAIVMRDPEGNEFCVT
jgi:Glyoxalase-like domain